jgi:hypothetical protein
MWFADKKEGPGRFLFRAKRQLYEGEWYQDAPKCGSIIDLPLPKNKAHLAQSDAQKFPIPPVSLCNFFRQKL